VTQLLRRQHCAKRAIESVAGMPYPTKYTRQYDFAGYQNSNPTRPLPGNQVNIDFDTVKRSITELVEFLKTSIRSDGKLANGSVGVNQLDATFKLGFSLPTIWEPNVDYTTDSTVLHDNKFYKAHVAHRSIDGFDESKWDLIVDFGEEAKAAAASAMAAAASETAAASSAAAAANSATSSADSATSSADSAMASSNSATAASGSATTATTQATAASGSADAAGASATAASGFADAAAASATAASGFADDASDSAAEAAASAAGVNLPAIVSGDAGKTLQVLADESGFRLMSGNRIAGNVVSLLSILTDAEAADVLSGTNSIDISAKIAAAITALATSDPGFTLDMSMLNGSDITVTQDWFAGLAVAKGRIVTGAVKLLVNFNNMNFRLPSHMIWDARGTKIESSTTITAVANGEGGIGYLVNTFVGGAGRTCSSTTSNTITVSDASGIEVGTTIAVFGTQRDFIFSGITLGSAINSTATSIPISGASTIDPALVMLRFTGTEYVYGLLSGGTFDASVSGGGRGKLGSTATSHLNGAAVLVLQSMVRTVIAKSGNVLTLDADVDITFSNAEFRFGTVGSRIVGDLQIDGKDNKGAASSASWSCLGGTLSADLSVVGSIKLIGGGTGGYMLMGARRPYIDIDSIDLCGRPASSLGASGWLFGSCTDVNIRVRRTSNGNISNAVDNKSSGLFSMGLWQPNYRFHIVHDVVLSHKTAHDVTASSDGYCGSSYADCSVGLAGIFDGLPQAPAAITPTGVTIEVKGCKTFYPPTGTSLGGTRNIVRIGGYVSGPTATVTVDGAPDDARVVFRSAGTAKWQLTSLGGAFNIYNGGFAAGVYLANQSATSWTAVSDRRVKTDIETLSVLDRLEGFNAVSYTNKLTGVREIGVIAQDEIERAPEFVHRGSGDDDDEITSMTDPRKWAVIYDRYGVEALQGVKELLTIVQRQQVEIDALKKQ
jgi:hypothetical protein